MNRYYNLTIYILGNDTINVCTFAKSNPPLNLIAGWSDCLLVDDII